MQSISESGRPVAASSLAPRSLVVEVYVAEQRAPRPARRIERAERARGGTRALAAVAVFALHAAGGLWLWTATDALRLHHPAQTEPLLLLHPITVPTAAHSNPVIDIPAPDLLAAPPPSPTTPRLPKSDQGLIEIAVSISAATDVLISEANVRDVQRALEGCGADKSAVTLLVRVEMDGRVSDSRIEAAGAPPAAGAVQRCLLAHGVLTPRRVNGAAVISWQRVHWPAAPTQAHLL